VKRLRAARQRLDVEAAPLQPRAELREVAAQVVGAARAFCVGDEVRIEERAEPCELRLSAVASRP
jgi:hypothetical protein